MSLEAENNSEFYKKFIAIGAPIALQHLISSSLNLIDTLMIGNLGENAIAAVGISNRVFFLFILFIFGAYSGCSIFTSQFWGKKDYKNIHKMLGIMIIFGFLFSMIFTFTTLIIPKTIMKIFTKDTNVINLGVSYLKIVSFSYVITGISFAYNFGSRSVHKTKLPMVVSAIALSMNTGLNYILINGYLGFPHLGVRGAAIATLISRTLELILLILFIYKEKEHPLKSKLNEMFDIDKIMIKNVVKTSLPVFVNEATWALGNTVYFIAFGMLGTGALAVIQIAYTVGDFFQALFMGIGNAAGVMIGNSIGNNSFEEAYSYGKKFLKITFYFSIIVALSLFFSRPLIILLYKSLESGTKDMLMKTLTVLAFFQIPKMFTFTMIVGIFRSGGDTKFCMILDLLTVWLIGVPLGFIAVIILNLPVHLVLACVFFEEIFKMFITIPHFIKKKWINNVIEFTYNEV